MHTHTHRDTQLPKEQSDVKMKSAEKLRMAHLVKERKRCDRISKAVLLLPVASLLCIMKFLEQF